MIAKKFAVLKARILQMYEDLKSLEQMPIRFINGDFDEDRRVKVRVPRTNKVSVDDLRPKKNHSDPV